MRTLAEQVMELARAPVLLVACDFDGTIAPIVSEPSEATADRESMVALNALAAMPQTEVAIISGRALNDLADRLRGGVDLRLVGSHGSEFEPGFATALSREAVELRGRLSVALRGIAGGTAGLIVEEKPAAAAFHYRQAEESAARTALAAIETGPAKWEGVHVRHGKKVVELSVVETNKGAALSQIRRRVGASAVLFLGDDLTDEDGFERLSGPDVGVKIGAGESKAVYRLEDSREAARLLARLTEARASWLAGSEAHRIEAHSLLSDMRTAALVDPTGRVVWYCLPRIDSPAVFAELLGGPSAGYFEIAPVGEKRPVSQGYVGASFVLETRWSQARVLDYLDCGDGRAFQRAGRSDLIRVIEGRGRVRIRFAPRLDFGRMSTGVCAGPGGVVTEGSPDPIVLCSEGIEWRVVEEGAHQTAEAEVELGDGPVVLEMRFGTGNLGRSAVEETRRRRLTEQHWSRWADGLVMPELHGEAVRRSALALRALCYGPSGAIAAAATTSLPESPGGVRNWDYRYCWPRDGAIAAGALVRLGSTGMAMKFLDWLLGVLDHCDSPDRLRPVYTVTGGHLGAEAEIGVLSGYRGSRPVRVGNAAAGQVQLDVFGPIMELLGLLVDQGTALSSEHWRIAEMMVEAVSARWREPDHGIWEIRMSKRHHVHSKVMCWMSVDRARKVAAYLGRTRPEWEGLAAEIAADVIEHGFNEGLGAFTASYETAEADASALVVGLSGMLGADDARFVGTVNLVEGALSGGGTVYRYRYDDGLPGVEGGFHLCASWLIEALCLIGRRADALVLLEQYVKMMGPTGLMAEEHDLETGQGLGNFPQAYSHAGLINAVMRLTGN